MAKRVLAVAAAGVLVSALLPMHPLSAQGRVQDTTRQGRATAEELHRQRRAALAAERAGVLVTELPRYGSAVVGAPGAGVATGTGVSGSVVPAAGEVPVVCTGVMRSVPGSVSISGIPNLVPGTFRGDCRPAAEYGWGDGSGAWDPADPGRGGGVPLGPGGGSPFSPYSGSGPYGSPWGSPYGAYGPYGGTPGALGPLASQGWPYGGGEYYASPFGLRPLRPFGWSAGPGGAYAFPWPGFSMGECVRVQVWGPGDVRTEILVGLQALGLAEASDLDLSIDQRLSRGQAVDLIGLDGRVLRLVPGVPYEDIRIFPCGNDTY